MTRAKPLLKPRLLLRERTGNPWLMSLIGSFSYRHTRYLVERIEKPDGVVLKVVCVLRDPQGKA